MTSLARLQCSRVIQNNYVPGHTRTASGKTFAPGDALKGVLQMRVKHEHEPDWNEHRLAVIISGLIQRRGPLNRSSLVASAARIERPKSQTSQRLSVSTYQDGCTHLSHAHQSPAEDFESPSLDAGCPLCVSVPNHSRVLQHCSSHSQLCSSSENRKASSGQQSVSSGTYTSARQFFQGGGTPELIMTHLFEPQ